MKEKVRNIVYKKAIARIEKFMSDNAHHWKQDIDFMKHLLEEKQALEKALESQQDLIKGKDKWIAKLCNDRAELKEEVKRLDTLQMFKKFVCQGVLCAIEKNHTYLQLYLTPELKEWCEKEMNKVVDKYGKNYELKI